ncbi:serine protease [Brevundimonas sp. PAMC22021]|uniref:trypsin-like serine peptidase n=1 Tax=Brevundimonas sp. PAMC22021 TaxID=2861285 RepID=UPI001C62745A|nr:serine protease [Brevundimonas sp. PAMC22021]QYF87943.1 serine protease [Brevundimonas sp. PAMC22021]
MFDSLPIQDERPVEAARPAWTLTLGLIDATVQIDQPNGEGTRTVGTAFLVNAPAPGGQPRTVLVTAGHVLDRMQGQEARLGWRVETTGGTWRFNPQPLAIRDENDRPLWRRHPDRDVAVMAIQAPDAFARAAIPLAWLAGPEAFDEAQVGPGDEMLTLGFPHGLSANRAGFPILRTGRIASWPLTPITAFPTFLLDFAVFPGNSGGPVFWTPAARKTASDQAPEHPYVAGILTQEVRVGDERLGIGVVAHAEDIRAAIALLDAAPEF